MEKPHKKLEVWKQSMELVIKLYKIIEGFPNEEKYILIDQIKRSAISIPSNIAEGAARNTKKEFVNFLHIAQGSLSELDTQLDIALKLDCLKYDRYKALDMSMNSMKYYKIKQVRPIFVEEDNEIIVVTVYTYFFEKEG